MSVPSMVMLPRVDLVEAGQQVDDGRLAGAGRPDQGDRLPGLGLQGHVPDDGRPGPVAEARRGRSAPRPGSFAAARHPGRRPTSAGVSMISKTRSAPARAAWMVLYRLASWRSGLTKFCA